MPTFILLFLLDIYPALCNPITLAFSINIIGDPEEPLSVPKV